MASHLRCWLRQAVQATDTRLPPGLVPFLECLVAETVSPLLLFGSEKDAPVDDDAVSLALSLGWVLCGLIAGVCLVYTTELARTKDEKKGRNKKKPVWQIK